METFYHEKHPTFWGKKGGKLTEKLEADVPLMGRVKNRKRKYLEQWRCFFNAYYRYYNDGDHPSVISRYFKKYKIDYPSAHDGDYYIAYQLEKLADIIFAHALLEKTKLEIAS